MIDELELSGEFVLDLRIKLCYTKGQNCEQDIAAVTGLRLPKPLCQLQLGQLPIPGIVLLLRISFKCFWIYKTTFNRKNISVFIFR